MRRTLRFLAGLCAGGAVLAGYLHAVGTGAVLARAGAVPASVLAAVLVLVVLEGLADSIGVWASIAPLDGGISGPRSVQFALAGDFFDILSPAGPVSSEPIMARFISVATGTGYSEALGVRSVAKYAKSGAQLGLSATLGLVVLFGSPDATSLLLTLGVAVVVLLAAGTALLATRRAVSTAVVTVVTPVVSRVSGLYREQPLDRQFVVAAVGRFWERVVAFRDAPALLVLIVLGGLLEQFLTAAALWIALAGVGEAGPFLPVLVVVPLPQAASVVPIPGSLGAYDLLLGGALVLATGTGTGAAAAAVLLVRTVALPFGALTGGLCAASLRGWRPARGR